VETQGDRVSYSFGLKLSKNFNTLNFNVSHSSDVKEGETADEAYTRVRTSVETKVDEEYDRQKVLLDSF
jgi:hypothetical protein